MSSPSQRRALGRVEGLSCILPDPVFYLPPEISSEHSISPSTKAMDHLSVCFNYCIFVSVLALCLHQRMKCTIPSCTEVLSHPTPRQTIQVRTSAGMTGRSSQGKSNEKHEHVMNTKKIALLLANCQGSTELGTWLARRGEGNKNWYRTSRLFL